MEIHTKDIESFNRVYYANKELIFRTALKYSGNYHVAQEITQNTFLQFYISIDNFESEHTLGWLVKTTKNAAFNHNKRAAREIISDEINEILDAKEYENSAEDVMIEGISNQDTTSLKEDILGELYNVNERWYDAMTLVYCMGRNQQEVADELGVSIEVLHSVLYRARKWVQKNYKMRYDSIKYV